MQQIKSGRSYGNKRTHRLASTTQNTNNQLGPLQRSNSGLIFKKVTQEQPVVPKKLTSKQKREEKEKTELNAFLEQKRAYFDQFDFDLPTTPQKSFGGPF
jgi:hypothetical protein